MSWSPEQIDDLTGQVALVTGANSGIGFETARNLARRGARVVLGCRSADRAGVAMEAIRRETPGANLGFLPLDLADQASVRAAADLFLSTEERLDILGNNAGIALGPKRRELTADHWELHLSTNFLGHFALTGLLLERALATPRSRIVSVGSLQHRISRFDHGDPHFERRRYRRMLAYGQTKLAVVQFMRELDRRLRAAGADTISVGAHPGFAATGVRDHLWIGRSERLAPALDWIIDHLMQTNDEACWPTLRAATDPSISGGSYLGPSKRMETSGPPALARLSRTALDPAAGRATWEVAERLTGVRFPLPG